MSVAAPPHLDLIWPDLVLHVLAHLESTSELPSSLYSESYVRAARQNLGEPSKRTLAADIELLSSDLVTHEQLAVVQLVARLHPSLDAARRLARLDLASLPSNAETDSAVRDTLLARCGVQAELLRCAALLEADTFLAWPLPDLRVLESALAARLSDLSQVAPRLRSFPVRMLRVLGMRGRLWPDVIAVGIPVEDGEPSMEHVCWQAAHEATVSEVAERSFREERGLSERDVERFAVALLARRASRSSAPSGYQRWRGRMTPEVARWAQGADLSDEGRSWLDGFAVEGLERSP